uniref:Myb-like domain-containing protein n=1 Tax=Kwoniella bestiolae CBS 10118 TaxID=1296100 RepID=A0A1B9G2Q8_9TREE|nr:hypothetical protein I302_05105 [Kwoniella bestiolae CBS 10118]OCF25291.1 hypothetical protein I302_05105 [Kwoniella bestiolae CBS 10118]
MPAVKRESSSTPSLDSDLINLTTPSTPKKAKPSPKKEKGSPNKPKQIKQPWTEQEDTIFVELIEEVLKESLYAKVKVDGRLQRESPAVRAHLIALTGDELT